MPSGFEPDDRTPPVETGMWMSPIQIQSLAFDAEAALLMEVQPQAPRPQTGAGAGEGYGAVPERDSAGEEGRFKDAPIAAEADLTLANQRLDHVELRLERIERRLMELSTVIARNLRVTFSTPVGPDGLGEGAPPPVHTITSGHESMDEIAAAPPLAQTIRPKASAPKMRDRELDEALETFLDSLAPQTRTRQ